MKRVLHVVSCLERGGTEAFIMNHYRMLDRTQYQFDFLVFHKKEYPYLEEIKSLGGRVFFCAPPARGNIMGSIKEMVTCMKEMGPFCAVHSHINVENAWVMFAAALAGVRVRVSHSHDTKGLEGNIPTSIYRHVQCLLIKLFATKYAACGAAAGCYLYGESLFKKNGIVIHNGIDVDRFLSVPEHELVCLKAEFSMPEKSGPIFGNITRFEDKKNQMFAVEVFQQIVNQYPNAIFLLGGPDGGKLDQVKQKVSDLGLSKSVRFVGERKDIPACLKLIDVYLFPSLYEGLPLALLEAQAAGCFCVASANVSPEADMGIGQVVFFDLRESPKQWSESIQKAITEHIPPASAEIRNAFQKRGYDIRLSADNLISVYETVEAL